MNEHAQKRIDELKRTKEAYIDIVLCGKDDPFKALIDSKRKAISGVSDSNLIALVRIKNSGKEALRYRQIANAILFHDEELQHQIREIFVKRYKNIEFFKTKNPLLITYNGTVEKTVWHHSPNHILTVSLIPEKIHRENKKSLHVFGRKGGNRMFTVAQYKD